MYLFQVKKKTKTKQKKRAWLTFYHRATKVETKFFLRKEVLEWLNPSLPDLLLDCLSRSHFDCTHRFCMNISPWIKRYDNEIAVSTFLQFALKRVWLEFMYECFIDLESDNGVTIVNNPLLNLVCFSSAVFQLDIAIWNNLMDIPSDVILPVILCHVFYSCEKKKLCSRSDLWPLNW